MLEFQLFVIKHLTSYNRRSVLVCFINNNLLILNIISFFISYRWANLTDELVFKIA